MAITEDLRHILDIMGLVAAFLTVLGFSFFRPFTLGDLLSSRIAVKLFEGLRSPHRKRNIALALIGAWMRLKVSDYRRTAEFGLSAVGAMGLLIIFGLSLEIFKAPIAATEIFKTPVTLSEPAWRFLTSPELAAAKPDMRTVRDIINERFITLEEPQRFEDKRPEVEPVRFVWVARAKMTTPYELGLDCTGSIYCMPTGKKTRVGER